MIAIAITITKKMNVINYDYNYRMCNHDYNGDYWEWKNMQIIHGYSKLNVFGKLDVQNLINISF